MTETDGRFNFLGTTRARFQELLGLLGEKPYHAQQILKWIHHRGVNDFAQMTDINKSLRAHLAELGEIREPRVVRERVAQDGTRKWLLESVSGSLVEMVFIPEPDRGTLCVSSQVGCALNCSFCATGKQGFNSNLRTWEIIGQVRQARRMLQAVYPERERAVTNIVLMGMGEPLLNFDSVMDAVDLMMDDLGYGLSKRRVTVSTSGVVPAIRRMAGRTDVSLAISLHAPDDALRNELVPINRKYPIAELLDACRYYMSSLRDKRTITMEYVLLRGVNDQPDHARRLADLLRGIPCKINLIPFNPYPGSDYRRPDDVAIKAFQTRLIQAGYSATLRSTRGQDIQAACGQLVGEVADRTRRSERHQERMRLVPRTAEPLQTGLR